ncbi:MAG: type II toxin-antitoxin system HicA family toxin [Chloroflexota bacterium]|nr:type II toxin-antitoxin system HicA family toxin [Chloroflexota bacterium]MDE2684078.1 type II toxin-antitoxin system HicA family toxin [Chloroflexota bacterium]
MRRRHRATLEGIFRRPTSGNIRWDDVESLLLACGAHIEERAGSRVGVRLGDSFRVLHRPHPGNNVDKGAVVKVREFLTRAGITPEEP